MESEQLTLEGMEATTLISNFKPTTELRGVYSLREPFKSALSGAIHTCVAVRKLSSLIADGEDVYEKYYKPYGLTETECLNDIAADKDLITLASDGGSILYFPVGYMESFPNMNGVVYVTKNVVVSLPPVPREQNLDLLITNIQGLVQRHLGALDSKVDFVEMSDLMLIPHDTDVALQAQRNANAEIITPMVAAEVWRQRYEAMKMERDELIALFESQQRP